MKNLREVDDFMLEHGFKALRSTKTGVMYSDAEVGGTSLICASFGVPKNTRNARNLIADVKRAVRSRSGPVATQKPEEVLKDALKKHKLEKAVSTLKASMIDVAKFKAEREPARRLPNPEPYKIVEAPKEEAPPPPVEAPKPQAVAKPPRQIRRFDAKERFKVWSRVEELYKAGNRSPGRIAGIMESEGFRMSNGDAFDTKYVTHVIHQCREQWKPKVVVTPKAPLPLELSHPSPAPTTRIEGLRAIVHKELAEQKEQMAALDAEIAKAEAPAPSAEKLPAFILALLTDPKMQATKKMLMLANLVKVSRAKVPDLVAALVEDPELNADEKLAMLMGYVDL